MKTFSQVQKTGQGILFIVFGLLGLLAFIAAITDGDAVIFQAGWRGLVESGLFTVFAFSIAAWLIRKAKHEGKTPPPVPTSKPPPIPPSS